MGKRFGIVTRSWVFSIHLRANKHGKILNPPLLCSVYENVSVFCEIKIAWFSDIQSILYSLNSRKESCGNERLILYYSPFLFLCLSCFVFFVVFYIWPAYVYFTRIYFLWQKYHKSLYFSIKTPLFSSACSLTQIHFHISIYIHSKLVIRKILYKYGVLWFHQIQKCNSFWWII